MKASATKGSLSNQSPFLRACLHVGLATVLISLSVLCSEIFDGVATDTGLQYYAESTSFLSSNLLPMPFNSAVNAGYLVVGAVWILRIGRLRNSRHLSYDDCYLFYVFSWMAIFYGPVQLMRILTQTHASAVLDQWFTLPIFAWVAVWCSAIERDGHARLDTSTTLGIMLASVLSYFLAVFHKLGFEVALTVHIITVICTSWFAHKRAPDSCLHLRLSAFLKAVVCCAGFVFLKLADHYLAAMCPSMFGVVSGHFWSKIADFMQIHYVCEFFLAMITSPVTGNSHNSKLK